MLFYIVVSKLVTYGADRDEAIARMCAALDTYQIAGVTHNINFLRAVMDNPRFLKGNLTTNFIPEEYPKGFHGYPMTSTDIDRLISIAALVRLEELQRDYTISGQLPSASEGLPFAGGFIVSFDGKTYEVEIQPLEGEKEGEKG
jgi:propionyl-CoA carboxylase alpha chain